MEEERMATQGSKISMAPPPPPPPEDQEESAAVAAAPPPVPPDDVSAPARGGAVLGLPAPVLFAGDEEDTARADEEEDSVLVADVVEEDGGARRRYEWEDELYESDDTDSDFEDNDWRFWDAGGGDAAGMVAAGPAEFLGRPTRFASFQNTAAFMRLAAAEAKPPAPGHEDDDGAAARRGEIVVHYRYTRFSRPRQGGDGDDGDGVEVRNWATKTYDVRFLVPFPVAAAGDGDTASSLRLAGAAVAAHIYPKRSYVQLQALWASMVAAAPVRVPQRATRVVVTVDAGILRRDDATPGRVARMLAEVEAMARECDALDMTCGTVMHLPAPVMQMRRDESSSASRPPPKKRRFAAVASSEEEECAICCEAMEKGLAAWPRCSHVFHGRCLEELLVRGPHRCPMCRRKLWTTS